MITLSKSGNTVTFTFDENSGYLQNGTIDVPVNSLSLILDESNMATFRKSASNDIFVSANVGDFGMSKSELEAWYKANMVGSTGGGGGGVTSGEVQTMIDNSISSGITSGDTKAVAGGAVYDQLTIGGGMEVISSVTVSSAYSPVVMPDCDKFTISAGTAVGDTLTSGGKVINVYDKSTDTFVFSSATVSNLDSNYVTVEGTTADTSIALTAVDGYYFKGDNSMMFKSNYSGGWVVTFYKITDDEWLKDVVSANTVAIEGKQDKLIEGRAIDITNNTVSLDLPISAGTGSESIKTGYGRNVASGVRSVAMGEATTASGYASHAEGMNTVAGGQCSFAEGIYTTANNHLEHACGIANISNTGSTDADKTLFSVGNGSNPNNRHNAFEIRKNGDIYCSDGTNDVKLQDTITATVANTTALGGLSLVKLTQAQYDALVIKDNSTLYVIVN